MININDTKSEI